MRETIQEANKQAKEKGDHFNLRNFLSRLYWRCHYLQKLESGHYLEFSAINPALNNLGRTQNEEYLQAFFNAQTGIPMVDASLRCLEAKGWINFRMRAMLVTYTSFSLWLDWKPVAHHLARLFLDFEPGIHYPQIQMQAGLTGYHTLRIFNPIVQGENHDPNGAFVKQWIPALKDVPSPFCWKPWEMTELDQQFYNCRLGKDYPNPIVDYDTSVRNNKDIYWKMRQSPEAKAQLPKLWRQFCIAEDISKYKKQLKKVENWMYKSD